MQARRVLTRYSSDAAHVRCIISTLPYTWQFVVSTMPHASPLSLQNHLLAAFPMSNRNGCSSRGSKLIEMPLGKVLYESGDVRHSMVGWSKNLSLGAAVFLQEHQLALALDSLGNDPHAQTAAHIEDCGDHA